MFSLSVSLHQQLSACVSRWRTNTAQARARAVLPISIAPHMCQLSARCVGRREKMALMYAQWKVPLCVRHHNPLQYSIQSLSLIQPMRPREKYAYSHTSAQAFYSAVYLYATPQRDLHISFFRFLYFYTFFSSLAQYSKDTHHALWSTSLSSFYAHLLCVFYTFVHSFA